MQAYLFIYYFFFFFFSGKVNVDFLLKQKHEYIIYYFNLNSFNFINYVRMIAIGI